ncbi:MAG: transcription termination factor Rho [Clostridium sp.]|nr:transcription termination factor Rho [Clostridium sp.]MCM1399458.1 transcription termination factor Rho [Clostridium sp.]MCM1460012.1 transcription termination factor Rho [Bacteroides sp.]
MDFKKASLAELRAYAKEKGIRNISTLKKGELAQLLENVEKMTSKKSDAAASAEAEKKPESKTEAKIEAKPEGKIEGSQAKTGKSEPRTYTRAVPPRDETKKEDGTTEPRQEPVMLTFDGQEYNRDLDSGDMANGILEVMSDGYGFIRTANYLPGDKDIYVSPIQIRRFGLKKGDIVSGPIRLKTQGEKFSALLYIKSINGFLPSEAAKRVPFEDLTPIFPNERISLDTNGAPVAIRIVDLLSPIGKGQRGMIVSPPKAGKTTLLKAIAKSISRNNKDMHLIVLLIDERPEEVTDIRESIEGQNVEVIYSTFDELPEHHKRVSEMVIERAKRLVEHKKDVVILLDSITRLARAYNLTVPPSGRTLSGGLDPAALHMPKRFFGAARNMREGGSLTILATALVDTGSRMDDVVFEEFKGTGNMELVLDRKLSEKRIFPAIDIVKSGTRRDDLLLTKEEQEAVAGIHKGLSGSKADEMTEDVLKLFVRTRNNREFVEYIKKTLLRR